MSISTSNFDPSKITFDEPRTLESGPGGRCKFVPILYDNKSLQMVTPKCFCWGLHRDTLNTQNLSYKLPLVMSSVSQEHTEEHKAWLKLFGDVVKKCQEHCKGTGRKKGVDRLDGCLYKKKEGSTPTLYAKVRYYESKKKFFSGLQKLKIKKCEGKMIDPLSVESERCEAIAVICLESIYVCHPHHLAGKGG